MDAAQLLTGGHSLLEWGVFGFIIIAMLVLDLVVFHKEAHEVSMKEAIVWSIVWTVVALIFNGWVYYAHGTERGTEFLTAYLIERSLSFDNLFVFLAIFTYFHIPDRYQHRVLFWGIFGALVMRALFILAGTALLSMFTWTIYVFGAFLIFTGIKLGLSSGEPMDPSKSLILKLSRKYLRTTDQLEGTHFFVRKNGALYITPLFLVLIVIEFSDVLFAVDSVPAVLAISTDTLVVYSSNAFAILGLRALYFVLAALMGRFRYLGHGLAIILVFIGAKMMLAEVIHISSWISLAVIAVVLTGAILISWFNPEKKAGEGR